MPRIAALQLLHPAIAAAGEQHSRYPDDLWRQMALAVPKTISAVYDGPRLGRRIGVDFHTDIKGTDDLGVRYHSLMPEIFHWEHAAFVDGLFTMVDLFDHRMSEMERERLYQECCAWYRRYGVSDRVVPADRVAFAEYFADVCANRLQLTPSALRLRDQILRPYGWGPGTMPEWAVRGLLPPRIRELLDVGWSPADDLRFRLYVRAIRTGYRALPPSARYVWATRRAFSEAGVALR